MNTIAFIVVSSVLIGLIYVILIFTLLREKGSTFNPGLYIINKFEPDNTAPKLTDMIEFHQQKENKIKYKID